jgi:hypothetical protein
MIQRTSLLILLVLAAFGTVCQAQVTLGEIQPVLPQQVDHSPWRGLAVSLAAEAAGTGFDAWTSWNRPERNTLLADGGRFTAASAMRKAGLLAGVAVVEVLVVKKWGNRHPWIARACRIGNFATAGVLVSAGVRNLGTR